MYLNAIRGIFSYKGRINRLQYLLVLILFSFVTSFVLTPFQQYPIIQNIILFFGGILFLPTQVKRLHDMNCSGWMLFLPLLPILGFFLVGIEGARFLGLIPLLEFIMGLCLLIFSGTKGPNKFGVEPHLIGK